MVDANIICEKLAELEHDQWVEWSKAVAIDEPISAGRLERWKSYWVPYAELKEHVKEHDRKWARKAMEIILNLQNTND